MKLTDPSTPMESQIGGGRGLHSVAVLEIGGILLDWSIHEPEDESQIEGKDGLHARFSSPVVGLWSVGKVLRLQLASPLYIQHPLSAAI